MPSGSRVSVKVYGNESRHHLNIYVYPLRADAYHTTGLCGNYNLNRIDDEPVSGYMCTALHCEAYRHERILLLIMYE